MQEPVFSDSRILQAHPFKWFHPIETAVCCKSGLFFRGLCSCATGPRPSAIPPRQHGGRSSDLCVRLLPLPAAPDSGQAMVPAQVLSGSPRLSCPAFSFCRILLGKHSSLQMAGVGGALLFGAAGPLWSDGREGGSSFWYYRPPLVSPLGCPHWHPLPLHRILPGLLVHKQMP